MTSLMNSLATQGAGPPTEAKILAEGAKIVAEGQAAADLFGDNMGLPPDSAASSDSRSSGYHSQQELFSEGGSPGSLEEGIHKLRDRVVVWVNKNIILVRVYYGQTHVNTGIPIVKQYQKG